MLDIKRFSGAGGGKILTNLHVMSHRQWEALLLRSLPVLGDEGGITPRAGSGGGGEEGASRLPARQRGQT